MLANNISRSSAILSKQRQALSFLYSSRALSSKTPDAAKSDEKTSKDSASTTTTTATTVNVPKRTAPRGLPTRHSRHHRPIVAPSDELDSSSQNILASIPGTLFCESTMFVVPSHVKIFFPFYYVLISFYI
jgi:hypothetical protein